MYLLLAFPYWEIEWHIPPQIPFFTINNISISVISSNFTLVFVKATYHANPGTVIKRAGSSSYIFKTHVSKVLRHIC